VGRGMTGRRPGGGRPVLAMVESNTTGTGRAFAAAAREGGLRPVLLSSRPDRYAWVAEDRVDVARVDTSDPIAVATGAEGVAVASSAPLAGLLTSSEYFVAVTARAAAGLGLPGPDPSAVEACRDKRRQRAVLEAAGVAVPAYAAAASAGEAAEVALAIGFPVVVKPADGTGSRGVRLCRDSDEVLGQAAGLLALRHDERGRPTLPAVLVEEYVEGPECSVETFGAEVVGVTAKHLGRLPTFVEIGHDFPAPPLPGSPDGAADARVVVLLPDEGHRYQDTVYDDAWLRRQGLRVRRLPNRPVEVDAPDDGGPEWSCLRWNRRRFETVVPSGRPRGAAA